MEVDFFFINGTILTSTHDETYIEVAFENSSFEASSVEKYDLRLNSPLEPLGWLVDSE